jgi:hypothetical protein
MPSVYLPNTARPAESGRDVPQRLGERVNRSDVRWARVRTKRDARVRPIFTAALGAIPFPRARGEPTAADAAWPSVRLARR